MVTGIRLSYDVDFGSFWPEERWGMGMYPEWPKVEFVEAVHSQMHQMGQAGSSTTNDAKKEKSTGK